MIPTQKQQDALYEKALRLYPEVTPIEAFRGEEIDVELLRKTIVHLLRHETKNKASPGNPLRYGYDENGKVIEADEANIVSIILERVLLLADADLSQMTPTEIVAGGYADTIRVFIKGEPHGPTKIKSKRWRLISSVSLVDQVIDKLLHFNQNKTEKQHWLLLPSCPGIGFDSKEAINKFHRAVMLKAKGKYFNIAKSDVVGFDWSVSEWEVLLEARVRVGLQNQKKDSITGRLIYNRAHCLNRSIFGTDDGKLYAQTPGYYGVQKSGTFNTSSTNSRIRVMIAWLIGALWAKAMGDDSLEDPVEGAQEKYLALGHRMKFYTRCTDSFEFCSHNFDGKTAVPVNFTKSLFRQMNNAKTTPSQMHGFLHAVRNHPDYERVMHTLFKHADRKSVV